MGTVSAGATRRPRADTLELALALPLLVWQVGEWLFHTLDGEFPYARYTPLLVLGIAGVWDARRRMRNARGARPVPRWRREVRWALGSTAACGVALVVWLWVQADGEVARIAALPLDDPRCSQAFLDATVAMEDGGFYSHHGFEPVAIHRALRRNLREGRIKQGGSTITQQLAKNLFLTKERTLSRKVREAFLALALERRLRKRQILNLYVSNVDYGMGQRGVRQAASFYYGKEPGALTLAESAVLVGSVPSQPRVGLDAARLNEGRWKALGRIGSYFGERYRDQDIQEAGRVPIEQLVVPLRKAERTGRQ